ncbi:phenylacetate--CoA ligase family protein [Parahaliea mediterranea]|uniref:Phenylacetate--CoA ligase family protein n=1 Tax=Parahaliea mediterranea TaxID=651086 RepID=A0A939DG48_9GAMM|nr:AMP-binding protein [Parahaliea mediterranea]MBN7797443.1 phenylacetate--CoA ligase family protein [Parahaliea mediterranea]
MSGLYTPLVSGLLFPLHERLKGHQTQAVFRRLEESQWRSPGELEALQIERLREFLAAIGRDVPYFRDLFAELGFDPQALAGLDDLRRLPTMGKAEIRANSDRLRATGAGPLARFNTGGSSGEPLVFYLGKQRISHDVAAKRRATRWWGVDIGDPEIVLWGSPIELGAQDRLRVVRDSLFRTELLPAFEMSLANMDRFLERIRRRRPAMLFGYPSSLSLLARHARQRGVAMDDLGIRVAFVTSERLYDEQRADIEAVFACPVANGYGARDAGFIAHQCPQGSLHISAEDIVVEVLRPDGQAAAAGESGELVVTHLATGEFPFVRYRTGDVGVLSREPCACGRGLPVLAEIQGRSTDFIVAADGTVMHGLALIYVLRDIDCVDEFRIVQESPQLTRVQVVAGPNWSDAIEHSVRQQFRQRLGESVEVVIEHLPAIPLEPSGKRRYVVSHVSP